MDRHMILYTLMFWLMFIDFKVVEGKINPIRLKQQIKDSIHEKHQAIKNQKKKVLTKILQKPLYEFLPPWVKFKPIEDEEEIEDTLPTTEDVLATNATISNTCHKYRDLAFKLPVKDPDDCHCFYHCAWGQVVGHECCPSNLAFNPITLTCDWVPNVYPLCGRNPPDAICLLPKDPGMCRGSIPHYHFDITTRNCKKFKYGGCGGNNNRFNSKIECERTCFSFLYDKGETSEENSTTINSLTQSKDGKRKPFNDTKDSKTRNQEDQDLQSRTFLRTELKDFCPETTVCKLSQTNHVNISSRKEDLCLFFLSGTIATCDGEFDQAKQCNLEKLFACHDLDSSGNVLVSSFTRKGHPPIFQSQILLLPKENSDLEVTSRDSKVIAMQPTTLINHISLAFFGQDKIAKQFPLNNVSEGNFLGNGLKLLIKLARHAVILVGNSFHEIVHALQNFDNAGNIPVGIISSSLPNNYNNHDFEEDSQYEEDDDDEWWDQKDPNIQYFDHQSQVMSNEEALMLTEDAELLNQINIGLEIIANDDHFNADLADAAFISNEKEVALKNAQSTHDYWVEEYTFNKQRQIEDIEPRTKTLLTQKHKQMHALDFVLNRIIMRPTTFTKESDTKLKEIIKGTFETFHNENKPILSSIPTPEARGKSGNAAAIKMFSISPSLLDALETLQIEIAKEKLKIRNVSKRSFPLIKEEKSENERSVSEYFINILQRIITTKRDMLSSIQTSTKNFMNNVLSSGKRRTPANETSHNDGKDENNNLLNSSRCGVDEFYCSSGECITNEYRCDSDVDCKDSSDELECEKYECPSNSFTCGDGSCIPHRFICDSEVDCKDGLDEEISTCKDHACNEPHDKFQCSNGACVDKRYVCDGDKDCKDGSDEEPCSECHKMMMFDCGHVTSNFTMKCLNTMYICDGIQDCADGSDEHEDRCRIKHEDYNMMMDQMPAKCKLIPKKSLTNLSTVCFDMSVKMMGPCTEGNVGKFPKCSLTDILGNSEQLQELLHENPNFVELIITTYFPKINFRKLKISILSSESKGKYNIKDLTQKDGQPFEIKGKELYVGSSSWPWNNDVRIDEMRIPASCQCLQNQEISEMTGIQIDFRPCSQPIPWCYVRKEANCYDQVESKNFGVKCPDCVLGMEGKEANTYLSNAPSISWSTAACSKENIPEILRKPYFF